MNITISCSCMFPPLFLPCSPFQTWILITLPCYMQHFFFPLTFAFLHIVLPELLTWRLNGKNLNVKLLSGSDWWPGRLHTSAKLSLFKAFVRLFIKRVKAQSRSSDSDAGSPQMSVFFFNRGSVAQPPGCSDQRDLQRPDSTPGAGAGAGQAVRRDPPLHAALRRA